MSQGSGMSLRNKLLSLTIATIVGLCVLFTALLINEKAQLLSDRQEKVRNLVEVAHATVAHFEKLARDGKLSVEEAQKQAMDVLRDMRYDKTEYFWVHGLNEVMIMHPIKPELDGKVLNQMKDPSG